MPAKKTSLASVMSESVLAATREVIEKNERFKYKGKYYVALVYTKDIGGLNQTTSENGKGEFIEDAKNGAIDFYADADLLEREMFLLIPTKDTLEKTNEYSFLSTCKRFVLTGVAFSGNDDILLNTHKNKIRVNFQQLCDVAMGRQPIERLLGVKVVNKAPEPEPEPEEMVEAPVDMDESEGKVLSGVEDISGMPMDEGLTDMSVSDTTPEGTSDEDVIVDDKKVRRTIEQHFYGSDIRLMVSSEPFDNRYDFDSTFTPLTRDRDDSWLGGYVSQLVKSANDNLREVHTANLKTLHTQFMRLITTRGNEILASLDTEDPNSRYYDAKQRIVEEAERRKNSIDSEVQRRRAELQQAWDKECNEYAQAASAQATAEYMERHNDAHRRVFQDIESNLKDDIDLQFNRNIAELNEKRQKAADDEYAIALSQILIAIDQQYNIFLSQEAALRDKYLGDIQDWLDEHRKEEFQYENAKQDERNQQSLAEKTKVEYESKLASMRSDYNNLIARNRQEMDAQKSHEEQLISQFNTRIQFLEDQNRQQKSDYDELSSKYININETKDAEYEARIQSLDADRKAALEHLAHVDILHAHANKLSIIVWVAITVAIFCIGIILGNILFGGKKTETPAVQPQAVQYEIKLAPDSIDDGTGNTGDASVVVPGAVTVQPQTDVMAPAASEQPVAETVGQ